MLLIRDPRTTFFPRDKVKSWIDFGEGRWRRDILVKAFAIIVQVRPDIYLEQNGLSTKNQFFYYSRLSVDINRK